MSGAQGALQAHPGSSRFTYAHEQAVPLPTPKLPATWRTPAVQLPLVRGPVRKPNDSRVALQDARQNATRLPHQPAQPSQPVPEETLGHMSTESDSDRSPEDKGKAKVTNICAPFQRFFANFCLAVLLSAACLFLQKKSDVSQSIRDYKGQSRQMITMAFLEEGGYFDVPIQVCFNYL